MSRPQKIHKPLGAAFNNILAAVGMGTGTGKRAAKKLAKKGAAAKQARGSSGEPKKD